MRIRWILLETHPPLLDRYAERSVPVADSSQFYQQGILVLCVAWSCYTANTAIRYPPARADLECFLISSGWVLPLPPLFLVLVLAISYTAYALMVFYQLTQVANWLILSQSYAQLRQSAECLSWVEWQRELVYTNLVPHLLFSYHTLHDIPIGGENIHQPTHVIMHVIRWCSNHINYTSHTLPKQPIFTISNLYTVFFDVTSTKQANGTFDKPEERKGGDRRWSVSTA